MAETKIFSDLAPREGLNTADKLLVGNCDTGEIEQTTVDELLALSSSSGNSAPAYKTIAGSVNADGSIRYGTGFTVEKIAEQPIYILTHDFGDTPYTVSAVTSPYVNESGGLYGAGFCVALPGFSMNAEGAPLAATDKCMFMFMPVGNDSTTAITFSFRMEALFASGPQQEQAEDRIAGIIDTDGTILAGSGFTVETQGTAHAVSHPFGNRPYVVTVNAMMDAAAQQSPVIVPLLETRLLMPAQGVFSLIGIDGETPLKMAFTARTI